MLQDQIRHLTRVILGQRVLSAGDHHPSDRGKPPGQMSPGRLRTDGISITPDQQGGNHHVGKKGTRIRWIGKKPAGGVGEVCQKLRLPIDSPQGGHVQAAGGGSQHHQASHLPWAPQGQLQGDDPPHGLRHQDQRAGQLQLGQPVKKFETVDIRVRGLAAQTGPVEITSLPSGRQTVTDTFLKLTVTSGTRQKHKGRVWILGRP
ncbi:MAG: hypothetical protein HQL73_12605 [Magnetococcales bacterium]|nr:hypothetical protein [Magnetococcales bacterium]